MADGVHRPPPPPVESAHCGFARASAVRTSESTARQSPAMDRRDLRVAEEGRGGAWGRAPVSVAVDVERAMRSMPPPSGPALPHPSVAPVSTAGGGGGGDDG